MKDRTVWRTLETTNINEIFSRSRGYSVTALTPPAALEKRTALANSHWICTGNIFNLRFLANYNINFLVTLLIKSTNMWALYLEIIVWFHEDLKVLDKFKKSTLTFNGQCPLCVGREISDTKSRLQSDRENALCHVCCTATLNWLLNMTLPILLFPLPYHCI